MTYKRLAAVFIGILAFGLYSIWSEREGTVSARRVPDGAKTVSPPPSPASSPGALPSEKLIGGLAHVWQTFNNCSSVGLLIALSHWGIRDTQEAIAEGTRPWNNPRGDNDDKSVTLYELADYARAEHDMLAYVRPNGTIELLKKFVGNDIPVVTRALMYPDQDIVHYRVIRGYDDGAGTLIESDGIQGPEVPYTHARWMHMWKNFNYSYLIVVPKNKKALVEQILGEETNERRAWENAKARAQAELAKDPDDLVIHYNLIIAHHYLGEHEETVREFEKIGNSLSRRVLWYQPEPIASYYELGNYDRVLALTDGIINDNNKSVSELYLMRGRIFESRGDTAAARAEYEKAIFYHKNYQPAKDALAALSQ
jgi:tetratricopeptide (TPR) repeat protein